MDSKFFDIPFRPASDLSDFSCPDGEIIQADDDFSYQEAEILRNLINGISFSLVRDRLPGWQIAADVFPSKTLIATEPSSDYWNRLAAQLLSQFQSDALQMNLFASPFLVRTAWRTVAGSVLFPSDPILLIPNSEIPAVTTNGDLRSEQLDLKVAGTVCKLYFKFKPSEVLREWVGKISSLEIQVSEPLLKFDSYSLLPQKHVSSSNFCECLDLASGEISRQRICSETLDMAWVSTKTIDYNSGPDNLKFSSFSSVPLSSLDLFESWAPVPELNILNPALLDTSSIITRPLKLSGAGYLKSIRHVYLRGNFNPRNITITVYGSRDMLEWWTLAKKEGGTVVSLPRSSFRFFKVAISGVLAPGDNLQGISLELRTGCN